MYELKEFPDYYLDSENHVIRKKDGKQMPLYFKSKGSYFKLKNKDGKWKSLAPSKILALAGFDSPPDNFVEVPTYSGIYISKEGKIWSAPTTNFPCGTYLTVLYPKEDKRYPTVTTGRYGKLAVHQLLAVTFIDQNYREKGLCVMHLDDNKHNFSLPNLVVGTYSENNKSAYDNGLNPGNGLKK